MAENKLSETLQIRMSRKMKDDSQKYEGDLSQKIRELIQTQIIDPMLKPKELTEKELKYHEEEAQKRRDTLNATETIEKEESEHRKRELILKEKLEEGWPRIKLQIETEGSIEKAFANSNFRRYYCGLFGIGELELKSILTERYNKEIGIVKEEKKIDGIILEEKFTDMFEEEWSNIKNEIDENGLEYILSYPPFLLKYQKILNISQSELKTKITKRYNEEKNNIIINVMS